MVDWMALITAAACVGCVIMGIISFLHWRRVREAEGQVRRFRETHDVLELERISLTEAPEFQSLIEYFVQEIQWGTLQQQRREKAEYLALQSQITPHFLFNTLEDIRSDALDAGMRDIATVIGALSTHLRYVLESENIVYLEDELDNVEDYYTVQKYRFGDRLNLVMELVDEHLGYPKVKIPKLTLQPIVENAITHGLEGKVSDGEIRISVERAGYDLVISVRDNGEGMDADTLRALNEGLRGVTEEFDSKDVVQQLQGRHHGIALRNVDSRIRLIYGDNYGLHVYSAKGVGTEVQIRLPVKGE